MERRDFGGKMGVPDRPAVVATGEIDGVVATMHSDGVLHVLYEQGVVVDVELAQHSRRLQAETAGGPYASVADVSRTAYIDRDAREYLSRDEHGDMVATAVVIGPAITQFVARRALEDFEFERPTATFHDPDEALAWARQQFADRTSSAP